MSASDPLTFNKRTDFPQIVQFCNHFPSTLVPVSGFCWRIRLSPQPFPECALFEKKIFLFFSTVKLSSISEKVSRLFQKPSFAVCLPQKLLSNCICLRAIILLYPYVTSEGRCADRLRCWWIRSDNLHPVNLVKYHWRTPLQNTFLNLL